MSRLLVLLLVSCAILVVLIFHIGSETGRLERMNTSLERAIADQKDRQLTLNAELATVNTALHLRRVISLLKASAPDSFPHITSSVSDEDALAIAPPEGSEADEIPSAASISHAISNLLRLQPAPTADIYAFEDLANLFPGSSLVPSGMKSPSADNPPALLMDDEASSPHFLSQIPLQLLDTLLPGPSVTTVPTATRPDPAHLVTHRATETSSPPGAAPVTPLVSVSTSRFPILNETRSRAASATRPVVTDRPDLSTSSSSVARSPSAPNATPTSGPGEDSSSASEPSARSVFDGILN